MTNKIKIANKVIFYQSSVFIIAEAGVNHNGRLDLALRLVDAAAEAGADAVKFQTFKAEDVATAHTPMARYQQKNTRKKQGQLAMLRGLELSEADYKKIRERCKKRGVIFISTPHGGFSSVDVLQKLKVPAFKFGSGDLTNLPLLTYAARFKKSMILGTGMATLSEVKDAVRVIKKAGNSKIILLHGTASYPCADQDINLRAMQTMIREFDALVGYSDHTLGAQVSLMAVTLGACVIEKHITLDTAMLGPDHLASITPDRFKDMVQSIRRVEAILGSPKKKPTHQETKMRRIARKSVVSIAPIRKGERFAKNNIGIKRPGTGLPPKYYSVILGKHARKNVVFDTLLTKQHYGQ